MSQTRQWFYCKECKSYRVNFKPGVYWECLDCGAGERWSDDG